MKCAAENGCHLCEGHHLCDVVALHWYMIQRIRLGNALARGVVSTFDQVVFGLICHNL